MERWLDNPTAMMGVKTMPVCPGYAFCPDFQWAVADVALKDGEKICAAIARRQHRA
jgi:hypothetical protein